jgi:cyclopropane fatty-acyl-phospholipid synthase-like methyltransferase
MTVKAHYDNHLAGFYSWMTGDLFAKAAEFETFLRQNGLSGSGTALDLGCGHGIQSIALAKAGYTVKAVDFSRDLLNELNANKEHLPIETLEADITDLKQFNGSNPSLIVCCGDTLPHLESRQNIAIFLEGITGLLSSGGNLVLSFRDYTTAQEGDRRFIPVKSDENRILTCFLEYTEDSVRVTDLLHERNADSWVQKISSYNKVRVNPAEINDHLMELGMIVSLAEPINRLFTIIAVKH